ncbi:MAG TPA: hypothetical protein VL225_20290 [Vicinamibacterales bacterium]|nr:hypothetical protein [Vicinamibacterales bacterium]
MVACSATAIVRVNGTGERVSALVEMTHPGVWTLGDLAGDDRTRGMGIVIEYAGHAGKAGLDSAEAIPLGLHALRKSGCRAAGARRSDRDDDREGQRSR